MNREGIDLIELIHYYLCYYRDQKHLSGQSLDMLKRQSNILYYTSRISRMLSCKLVSWDTRLRNRVYFIAYLLCIKYLLDIRIHRLPALYTRFGIPFTGPIIDYEMYCFSWLQYDFSFLERRLMKYDTGRNLFS